MIQSMLVFIVGLSKVMLCVALGSFFNVVSSRKDWYKTRSRCDHCGHVLSVGELIPFCSYIIQRGKCRCCGRKIYKAHVVAEALALCGGVVFALCGLDFVAWVTMLVLLFNAIMDYKTRTVDSLVTYGGCLMIFAYNIYEYSKSGFWPHYVLLMLITALVLFVLAMVFRKQIGEGDFDIIFLLILSLGHIGFLYCLFYASVIGVIYAIFKRLGRKTQIPFAPLFYLGYLVSLLLQGGG